MAERPALARPHWGHRTSLFQWRQPAFYLYVLLMLGSLAFVWVEQAALQAVAPSGWMLSWFLMLIYAVPVFLLIYFLDLYEREPLSLVFGAILWGGIAAVALASIANLGWGLFILNSAGPEFLGEWGAALTAPFTEEILKASGIVLVYLIARSEFDDVLDGFVYGAMVGLGFTIVEDVFYFIAAFGGTTEGVLQGFFYRVIVSGLYGHLLFSGLAGMGIAYFTSRRGHAPFATRLGAALGLFLLGVFGHFLWNSPLLNFFPEPPLQGSDYLQLFGAAAVKGLPFLALVALMIKLAHRREHRWLAAALAGEIGKEGLTPEEWEQLRTTRTRRSARAAMRKRAGPHAGAILKRLQRQQINLAMLCTRLEEEHPDLLRQRAYCRTLRDALHGMPGARPAQEPTA